MKHVNTEPGGALVQPVKSSLFYKILMPSRRGTENFPVLVLLHGRGANEDDLLSLAEYLDDRLCVISVRAPHPFPFGGFTWYDIEEVGQPEPKMFAESYQRLTHFFEDIKQQYPIDSKSIFFLGFSMGTVMSYSIALTNPESVAGVIANSGYIPEGTNLKFQWEKVNGKHFFVGHGRYDPVIPLAFGTRAKQLLEEAHAKLTYREYDMGHQINEESLGDLSSWLTQRLNK